MNYFKNGDRVRVRAHPQNDPAIIGMTGTVVRLRRGDNGAWVRMDADLPDERRSFPAGDERARDLLLYPDECEAAHAA